MVKHTCSCVVSPPLLCVLVLPWHFHLFIKDGGMWHLWFCFNIQKAVSDMSGKTTSLLNKMNVCLGLWYQKVNIFGASFWERKKEIERADGV